LQAVQPSLLCTSSWLLACTRSSTTGRCPFQPACGGEMGEGGREGTGVNGSLLLGILTQPSLCQRTRHMDKNGERTTLFWIQWNQNQKGVYTHLSKRRYTIWSYVQVIEYLRPLIWKAWLQVSPVTISLINKCRIFVTILSTSCILVTILSTSWIHNPNFPLLGRVLQLQLGLFISFFSWNLLAPANHVKSQTKCFIGSFGLVSYALKACNEESTDKSKSIASLPAQSSLAFQCFPRRV
jgi:hypothetical protein